MLRNSVRATNIPKTRFARRLRSDMTPGEKALWFRLRGKKFHGLKFRRQVPIGPYIVDFLCAEKQLIIEVDGDSHYEPGAQERDAKREAFLRAQGFHILRISSRETALDVLTALSAISRILGFSS